ncbi:MAG TPA: glycerophosphodiester phosphodiesterase [Gammaproteobacteria bacterium]|jgi:glycerophosphoryl diester phosphodiesterase|nr:glycerophosphodiester phosphodiesterase [Gammaproteobacteria bacterium]
MHNPFSTQRPLLFAHRGSCQLAPENTFAAFDVGLQAQADVLEIDVRLSRDNTLMVIHDVRVDRTTEGVGAVRDHTVTSLKKLDAGYRFRDQQGARFRGQQVRLPTLLELYQAYPHTLVNIDIKDKHLPAARRLADTIEQADAQHRTTVASFHSKVLRYFRQIAPHIATAATFGEVAARYVGGTRLTPWASNANVVALQIPLRYGVLRLDGRSLINRIHRNGQSVHYWTVNTPDTMRALLQRGADGVVTDRPDLALQVFRELGFK